MEQTQTPDKNPFPNFNLFRCPPPIDGIANAIRRVLDLGATVEPCLTEHNTGAAAMLDEHLDEH